MALTDAQRAYAREYQRKRRRDPDARAQDREWTRQWRERNREKAREDSRRYYHEIWKHSDEYKNGHRKRLLRKYGLTEESYAEILSQQSGGCAICGTTEGRKGSLVVDHDHATGKVRGLLCDDCNLILGYAKDDTDRLRDAVAYLEGQVVI